MSTEFKREQRYFVVKVKDAKEYLDDRQLEKLAEIADTISEGRKKGGIPDVECVVVESDWPEYESTWKAIEARVTGVQPAPTIAEQDQINAEAAIRSIYDARLSDEALWQTIGNGMITPAHIAQAVVEGTITPAYIMHPASSVPEGVSFMDTSQLEGVVSAEIVHSYPPPSGWIRAIDEALVVTHLGVANASDTYEQAKAKLDSLVGFHVDVATDPAVNGGWKLVPRPPTPTMVKAGLESSHVLNVHRVLACYDAMIDAAPEAKR